MFCNGNKCGFFVNHFKTKDMRRENKLQQLSLPHPPSASLLLIENLTTLVLPILTLGVAVEDFFFFFLKQE